MHGKNVVHMTSGTDEMHFFYDAQNRPAVVVYNGTAYAYVKSLQGDIVAILDENGNTVVSYGYDAWGAPLRCTGELAETLGKVQPFRYRGDVFDEERGCTMFLLVSTPQKSLAFFHLMMRRYYVLCQKMKRATCLHIAIIIQFP